MLARPKAIKMSLMFTWTVNSDDLWMSEKLEKQIGFMEKNGYSFSYTNHEVIDMTGQ